MATGRWVWRVMDRVVGRFAPVDGPRYEVGKPVIRMNLTTGEYEAVDSEGNWHPATFLPRGVVPDEDGFYRDSEPINLDVNDQARRYIQERLGHGGMSPLAREQQRTYARDRLSS